MLFVLLSTFAALLCVIHLFMNYNEKARLLRKIPGPKELFIVGNAFELVLPPVELFQLGRKYAALYDGIYRFRAYPLATINIYNPDDIEIILSSTQHNEKSMFYRFLKPWLQEGLLLSGGSKWYHRRKILTPAFHFNILRKFCVIIEENSNRLVEALKEFDGESIDVVPVISEYTLHSICETAMGTQLCHETSEAGKTYKEAIYKLGNMLVRRFSKVILHPDFIFNLSSIGRNQKKFIDTIHSFTKRVIEDRRQYAKTHGININENIDDKSDDVYLYGKKKRIALLDLLLSSEEEGLIDKVGIQEEVDTFMFEGHDTTASGLTYCLMLLACNKKVQDNILRELYNIIGDTTRPATYDDLSKMKYLECCIKESLRLYPPVYFISRTLSERTKLSNYTIPEGVICNIHIYDLHRSKKVFKDPLVFDPERFLPENSVGRHPYAYIPFSAGPRNCIGQKFAMLEMKSALAAVLRKFELLPVTQPSGLKLMSDLVLRNSTPVYVKFKNRNKVQ